MSRILIQDDGAILRDGRYLHSQRDAYREAGLWVAGRPANLSSLVFVLGLGAAHHVIEWQRQSPQLTLVVCDFDTELFVNSKIQNVDAFRACESLGPGLFGLCLNSETEERGQGLLERGYSVVRFRPAWTGRETEFNALENSLLDRNVENLDANFLTISRQQWPRGLDLNIKSLTADGIRATDLEDQKLLAALRELIV